MSERIEYWQETDLQPIVEEIAKRVQRRVDQAALDKVADTLAEFGYVKVVRCQDCYYCETFDYDGSMMCEHLGYEPIDVTPNSFCSWAKRKVGG